jgi:hypothetical protein
MAHKPARTASKSDARKKLTLKKVTIRNLNPQHSATIKGGTYPTASDPNSGRRSSIGTGPRCVG